MKIWTMEEEARKLSERFEGVNRAEFARDNKVSGGQAMVYQHITGRRPISLDAAQAYAQGFRCTLEEISPRLAMEVRRAASLGERASQISKVPSQTDELQGLTLEQQKMLSIMKSISPEDREAWLKVGASLAKSDKSLVNDALPKPHSDQGVNDELTPVELEYIETPTYKGPGRRKHFGIPDLKRLRRKTDIGLKEEKNE